MKWKKIKINIPNNWDDITLENYQNIYNLSDIDLTNYDDIIIYIHNLLNIDTDTLKSISENDLMGLIKNELNWINEEIQIKEKTEIELDNETYTYNKNFNQLTLGEIISFEVLIEKTNKSYLQSMGYVLGLLLRKKNKNGVIDKFDDEKIIPYKDKFLQLSITDCLHIIKSFFEWRKNILSQYENLFKSNNNDEETSISDEPILPNNFKWLALVDKLAGGDITKFDNIFSQNYISCLNLLSYWKERDDYVNRMERRKQQLLNSKYRRR